MTFLRTNIYHLAGLLLILVLFVLSVFVRKENHSVPLTRHHEWITAHTLITCEIWRDNGGPSAYHFSPVYTYPGEGNHKRRMLGGVVDEKGDVYYVSYPPFSFLFAYYATQLMGGPDTDSIRTLNLSIHFLCAVFLYLIAVALSSAENKSHFSIAGVVAAFLYLFSTGNLWIHGNLYFADMLVQLFVIAGLYAAIRLYRGQYKNEWLLLSALAALFFLATYTEWLGLLLSFFVGCSFLIAYFMHREKVYLKAFFTLGFSAALAIGLTLLQYTSIAGWDQLKEVSLSKYEERSGHEVIEEVPNAFTLENEAAYDFMIDRIDGFYKMAENFVGLFGIVFLLLVLIPNLRRKMETAGISFLILLLLGLAIFSHYYLFFNFNALHDFSSLKTGFFFVMLVLIFSVLVESALAVRFRIVFFVLVVYLCIDKGLDSIQRYRDTFPLAETDWDRMETGAVMREYGKPDAAIFMNITSNPELVYAAGHNVFPLKDTADLKQMMIYYNNTKGQYYHHQGSKLDYILEFELEGDRLVFRNRMSVHPESGASGSVHQK